MKKGIVFSTDRVRNIGAGRRQVQEKDPLLESDLDALVEPKSRGDPESPYTMVMHKYKKLGQNIAKDGSSSQPYYSCKNFGQIRI